MAGCILACEMERIPDGNWEDPDETVTEGFTFDGHEMVPYTHEFTPQ